MNAVKTSLRLVVSLLVFQFISGCGSMRKENNVLREAMNKLRDKNDSNSVLMAELQSEKNKLSNDYEAIKKDFGNLDNQRAKLESDLERLQDENRDLLKMNVKNQGPAKPNSVKKVSSSREFIDKNKLLDLYDKNLAEISARNNNTESITRRIAFFCPEKMKEKVSYEVRAMLGVLFDDEEINNELLNAVNETREERNEAPLALSDIKTKEFNIGKYLEIKLIDPDGKFNIQTSDIGVVSLFDEKSNSYYNKTFEWAWLVSPKENTTGETTLIFEIVPFDNDMKPLDKKTRHYKVKIKLKDHFIATLWEKINRDPEWAMATVITPVLTFFGGLALKRRKKEDNEV